MTDMTRSGHRQFIEAGERKYQERKTMPNVKTVQDRTNGALLVLDDGVKVWTPDKELARTLLGKPIPPDWTRRENENGPMALPPKPRGAGGMTAWRNTKEGFEAEATGRRRWQEIEEERRDRRTALMQAVESLTNVSGSVSHVTVIERAELFYDWLRESSPAVSDGPKASAPVGDTTSPAAGPAVTPRTAGAATTEARGPHAGDTGPVAAGVPQSPGQDPGPTSSAGGEAAGQGSGEGSVKTSPGSTTYPMSPDECDHKFASGGWLKTRQVEGVPVCPRCGMSAVLYRES